MVCGKLHLHNRDMDFTINVWKLGMFFFSFTEFNR